MLSAKFERAFDLETLKDLVPTDLRELHPGLGIIIERRFFLNYKFCLLKH